jgi:putative ABC transport system ATP-binding protein
MAPILRVRELYKFFDQRAGASPVLKGISFDVEPGEFVCIMGPSGSGKSTLLHILSGLDAADGGAVELAGRNLKELSDPERTLLRREQVGYVFQFFNLLPNLNLLENVGLPLAIQGSHPSASEGTLRALLARLGLAGKEGQFPHQLSGGEMQRTSIVRALAGGQPLLLCDEPTGNLSQKAGLEVMRILRQVLVDGSLDVQHGLRGPNLTVEAVHERLAALHI